MVAGVTGRPLITLVDTYGSNIKNIFSGAEFGETGIGNNSGNRSSDHGANGYVSKVIAKQISDWNKIMTVNSCFDGTKRMDEALFEIAKYRMEKKQPLHTGRGLSQAV